MQVFSGESGVEKCKIMPIRYHHVEYQQRGDYVRFMKYWFVVMLFHKENGLCHNCWLNLVIIDPERKWAVLYGV